MTEPVCRISFQALQESDFDSFFAIHANPQNNLFNPAGPMDIDTAKKNFSEWLKHWATYHFGGWVIRLAGTENIIGFGGLSYRLYGNELRLNLGYRFDHTHWGKGYATELAQNAITYGFDQLLVHEIFAVVRPQHAASIKVLEKCGLTLFETLDDVPGQEHSLVYSIKKANNKLPG